MINKHAKKNKTRFDFALFEYILSILLQIRTLSSVLLRRLFTNEFEEVWPKLSPELQAAVKEKLMCAITEELTPPVRRKVCDATAELARNMIGKFLL